MLVYGIITNASRLWVRHLRKLATKIKEYAKEYIYIRKEFWEKAIQFHGTVHGLKIKNWTVEHLPTKAVWWDAPLTHRDFSHKAKQYARPFDQNLGSPLIYFFYLHTTIRLKYMILFNLIFLLCTTIRPKIKVLIDLFLLCAHDHSVKLYGSFILFLFCARPFDQKLGSSLIYLFVHDHSTKN